MEKVTFVILNYNTEKEVIQCINSIEKILDYRFYINYIVVDNCSKKQSLKELKCYLAKLPNAILLEMEENFGFSKANNFGYRYAIERYSPDFICIINSDVKIIQKNFLYKMSNLYGKYRFDVLGPDIYVPFEKKHQSPALRGREYNEKNILTKIFELENELIELNKKKEAGITHIPQYSRGKVLVKNMIKNIWAFVTRTRHNRTYLNVYLHGAALIFSRKYMEKYPYKCFEPEVFMYGEEDLLKYKCNCNGDIMLYSPKVRVLHMSGTSFSKTLGNRNNIDRVIFYTKYECLSKKALLEEIRKR